MPADGSSTAEKVKVTVCIITYQRPEGLKRLLEGLNKLAFDKCKVPELEVIVVDNDVAGSAYKVCEETRSASNWSLKYFVEPRRGIPYARNKAVASAQEGHPDFIAFIDDDEVPERSWLDELLYVQHLYQADVVAGPVLPHFTVPVAPWVKQGRFFERRRMLTGTLIEWAGTGNVLVRSEVFEKMGESFDERLVLSGGEDSTFFWRVHRRGYKLVWADEALAYEWLPKSRANVGWLLRRAYRVGNINSRPPDLKREPSIAERANLAAEAIRRTAKGLLELRQSLVIRQSVVVKPREPVIANIEISVRLRHVKVVRGLRHISYSAGMLAGLVGMRYEEYRRTHRV
jgi:glycosyltransferase involved in cell wall biosynthesis